MNYRQCKINGGKNFIPLKPCLHRYSLFRQSVTPTHIKKKGRLHNMNPYSYSRTESNFNAQLIETTPGWLRYSIDFPSAHPTRYKENNTVTGEYFQPRGVNNAPLAILVHGMGDRSIIPCKFITRTLTKKGIACFILYSVFHSKRMPEIIKNRLPVLTPEEWFEGYQISVIDVHQVTDWACAKPEIDQERIALIGISLGGLISAIAMGIDKRIKTGIFLIAGGNSEKITWGSKNPAIRKGHNCTESQCHQIRTSYPQYLAEVADKGFENVIPAKDCFLTDPMTFATYLRKRPILMVNATWDEAIPKQATIDFWEACDKPAIMWLPATHITIWLWYPFIGRKIDRFLSSAFDI